MGGPGSGRKKGSKNKNKGVTKSSVPKLGKRAQKEKEKEDYYYFIRTGRHR